MSDYDKCNVLALLEWRDAAMRTCPHLGMYGGDMAAYLLLCKQVGKVPVIGGKPRPDLLAMATDNAISADPIPIQPTRS